MLVLHVCTSSCVILVHALRLAVYTCLQVVVCSACSGHGYKFCSVMGEILADLALTGNTCHDIDFIRFNDARPGQKEMMHGFNRTGAPVKPISTTFPSKL